MLAPWLLYASAMGCVIAVVALLLERIARWRNRPTRWIWLVAVIAIVALPIALNLVARAPAPPIRAIFTTKASAPPPSHSFDRPLLALWLLGSLLLSARLIGTAVALRRRRDRWIAFDVNGSRVLIADELGPAVVGWTQFVTVIPRWAFALDDRARALMLRHESEHVRSGDPYLRTIAIAGLVLMPWNLAIWWSMRRLRLAVEVDCDRRLIVAGVDPYEYASLLLAVGERISATPFAWATALAGSRSSLETRILAMTSSLRPRHIKLATLGVCAVAAALIAIACASPVPDPVVPPSAPANVVAKPATFTHDSQKMPFCGDARPCGAGKGHAVLDNVSRDKACNGDAGCEASADSARKVAEHRPYIRSDRDSVVTVEVHAGNGVLVKTVKLHAPWRGNEPELATAQAVEKINAATASQRDSVRGRP